MTADYYTIVDGLGLDGVAIHICMYLIMCGSYSISGPKLPNIYSR